MQPSPDKILFGSQNHFEMDMRRTLAFNVKKRKNLKAFVAFGVAGRALLGALKEEQVAV